MIAVTMIFTVRLLLSRSRSAIENLFSPLDPAKMLEYKLEAQSCRMSSSSIMKLSKLPLYCNGPMCFVMYCAITMLAHGTFQFVGVTATPMVIFRALLLSNLSVRGGAEACNECMR